METTLHEIAAHLRQAERILFITGAGMSADSGLPTYRGIGGLYNGHLTEDEVPIEVALSGDMMQAHPAMTWKYLMQIEQACRGAQFNVGHQIIAQIEQQTAGTWVLTQNIDGFHRAAGSRNVIEIHGRLMDLHCVNCDYADSVTDYSGIDEVPPICPKCGSLVRPQVVLFGEMLPHHALHALQRELIQGFDLVFSIGTTSVFPYIAQPVMLARAQGIPTVEINPGHTEISHLVEYKMADGAATVLTKLWELLH